LAPASTRPDERVLALSDTPAWAAFKDFACATAAFPLGFPARLLSRPLNDYRYRIVLLSDQDANGCATVSAQQLIPDWAAIQDWTPGGGIPVTYQFTSVDGGATNNEPIALARQALGGITKQNPRDGSVAQRAVLLIDPFAGSTTMAPPLDQDVPALAGALITTLLQQTRYDTRDIVLAGKPDVFSRFMISAYRNGRTGDAALATSGLGAFIGFASDLYRRHDYLLGRKNCQDFLRNTFVLPADNPIFGGINPTGAASLPIIPLTGACIAPEVLDPWPAGPLDLDGLYRQQIESRLDAILSKELPEDITLRPLVVAAGDAALSHVATWIIGKMNAALPQPDAAT
jgi:hypothetical protein